MYVAGSSPPPDALLDLNMVSTEYQRRPYFAYPTSPEGLRQFRDMPSWYGYVTSLRIQPGHVLLPYIDAFDEALRALCMTYLLPEFSKFGEMKALATLEGALLCRGDHAMCKRTKSGKHRCAGLKDILSWMNEHDVLPPEFFESRSGRAISDALTDIRNRQMHGYLLEETLPWAGLFESVKVAIEFAYKDSSPYDVHQLHVANSGGSA
jgi:hypothetical protein